jgi:hypothetical protein
MDLAEYKLKLADDPTGKNEGPWYARSTVQHDALTFKAGQKLPELTNEQVLQLLDVNALTSVAPRAVEGEVTPPSDQQQQLQQQ